jgi:glutamate N-acetyltransferase/amino-acid N-acetyltransferase
MPRLLAGLEHAVASADGDGGPHAAQAIMTTDTVPKTATVTAGYRIGGMAKGAGMLAPGMATMLCVVATDAVADAATLGAALRHATGSTFDRVDADGCMSTNDTVILMASGASGIPADDGFTEHLRQVTASLARQLVADAEGATKLIDIRVRNAVSEQDAVTAGRAVARSALFKCAMFGEDPNWGRVLSAVGTTDAYFDPLIIDVAINGVQVCRDWMLGTCRQASCSKLHPPFDPAGDWSAAAGRKASPFGALRKIHWNPTWRRIDSPRAFPTSARMRPKHDRD